MKEKTLAYAAGMLDADGCVGLYAHRDGHDPILQITNCNRPLMNWFVLHFGGTFKKQHQVGQDIYIWRTGSSKHIARILTELLPFMRVKAAEAKMLLDALAGRVNLSEAAAFIKEHKTLYGSVETDTSRGNQKHNQAYLAGFLDGEGNISLSRFKHPNTVRFLREISVTNECVSVLNMYINMFGGKTRKLKLSGNRRDCYRWSIHSKEAMKKCLLYLLPYLVVKKDRACVMLEFASLKNDSKEPLVRQALYERMARLNPKIQSDLCGDAEKTSDGSPELLTA